jgi:hypothetical protein
VVHQGERSGSTMRQTVRMEEDSSFEIMARWHQEGVPTPEERVNLIKHAHKDLGYFGVRRTYNLLQIHY